MENKLALIQAVAWCQTGAKPLPAPVMTSPLIPYGVTNPQWVNMKEDVFKWFPIHNISVA